MVSNASIGAIGRPYYDGRNDRTKAFLTTLLTSVQEVEEFLEQVLKQMQGARLSVRVLTRDLSVEQLRSVICLRNDLPLVCEAVMPINQRGDCIAYYGWNGDTRRTSIVHRWQEMELLRKVKTRSGHHRHDYGGYAVEVSPGKSEWAQNDIEALLTIFQATFSGYLIEFTRQSVVDMLRNNWVSVVRRTKDNLIVAVAMAEIANVDSDLGDLQICELSEVATHPDFQRRGLSHLAFGQLLQAIVESGIDVIFSETRAASYGMMAVAHDAGLLDCGRLEQHCVISSPYSDVGQDGVYGDLVVFALPPRR